MAAYQAIKIIYLLVILTVNPFMITMDGNTYRQQEALIVSSPEGAAMIMFGYEYSAGHTLVTGKLYEIEPSTGFIAEIPLPEIKFENPDLVIEKNEFTVDLDPEE